jgi:hypothetical protein
MQLVGGLFCKKCIASHHPVSGARPWQIVALSALVFSFMASGCCRSYDAVTKATNEAASQWLHRWPGPYDWTGIDHWKSVAEPKLPQAELLLRTTPSVRMTTEQVHDLIGESTFSDEQGAPYLLRAVGDSGGKWPQEVYIRPNGEVWVGGGANSRCPVPMRRRAIVVWLKNAPTEVYVTFVVGK